MMSYRLQPPRPARWLWATVIGLIVAAAIPLEIWAGSLGQKPPSMPVVLRQPGYSFSQEVPGLECPAAPDMQGGYNCGPVQIGVFAAYDPVDATHTLQRAIRATFTHSYVNAQVRDVRGQLVAIVPDEDIVALGFQNPADEGEYLYVVLATTNSVVNRDVYPAEQSRRSLAVITQQVWDAFHVGDVDLNQFTNQSV